MFRTNFRYENGKEDTFYMSTTADALLGEYAKEYYEILLKEAKTFYFRLCYPNDSLPSCIMNAPRAPLKAFYDTIGLLMSGDVEKPKDWDGDYEKLPGDWKELYRMLPVDEDVKKYLLNRGFTISTGAMHTITIQAENGAMINTEIDFDGVDDYLAGDLGVETHLDTTLHSGTNIAHGVSYTAGSKSRGRRHELFFNKHRMTQLLEDGEDCFFLVLRGIVGSHECHTAHNGDGRIRHDAEERGMDCLVLTRNIRK